MSEEDWINSAQEQIIEDDDKILFKEASGCFLSGYYRSAYIISWISLIESLKRKIHILSNLGDSRATDAKQKIEDAENDKQSADKLIFEEAKNCGIIDNADYSKVSFLWEQRCLFAHPYNLKPEIDEVKHIIGQSIRISLGKDLHFNKTYLTELSDNISKKPFFLPTEIDQVRKFANRTISRIQEDLHPFFFKTLLFKVGEIALDEEKFHELRKLRYFIVELFINTKLPLDNPEWSLEHRVTNYPYECFIGLVHQETWNLLPERIKEMLISYLEGEKDSSKLIALKSISGYLVQHNKLEEAFISRYHKKLNSLTFDNAIHFYGEPKSKFKRIWTDLSGYQYDEQNPVIDYLRTNRGVELINGLDKEKQINLGRMLKSAASNSHYKSQNLITSIKHGSIDYSEWLKSGIAIASFSSLKDEFDLDKNSINRFVTIMNELSEETQNGSYDFLESLIDNDKVSEWVKLMFNEPEFIDISTKALESVESWDTNNKKRFESLTEKIIIYFAQEDV
nr:hypothetical protein [uncultured Brumimicrobium sp.]